MAREGGRWTADRGTSWYRWAALAGLLVTFVGFFLTYTKPVVTGDYAGPWWGHIHGALALAWVLLIIAQTQLVGRNIQLHRKLGLVATLVIPLWFASTVAIYREVAQMQIAQGNLDAAVTNIIGSLASPLLVMILVGFALALRKRPQAHKRLMFVATVLMLWPAWARWRNYFPDPDPLFNVFGFWIALAPILIAMVRDRLKFGKVHPALFWGGSAAIGEQAFEILAYGSVGWNRASAVLFEILA